MSAKSPIRGLKDESVVAASPTQRLYAACVTGDIHSAKRALKDGASLNYQGHEAADTPLRIAAQNDRVEVVRELLMSGAEPELKNTAGRSAADIAASHRNKLIEMMINDPPARTTDEMPSGEDALDAYHVQRNRADAAEARAEQAEKELAELRAEADELRWRLHDALTPRKAQQGFASDREVYQGRE